MMNIKEKGIIEIVVVIVLAIVMMSLFGVNLRAVIESETLQENFAYVKNFVAPVWDGYMVPALTFLWTNIFLPYMVAPLKGFFD